MGALGTTLTVTGGNFVQGTELTWNGSPRATLYVSSTTLQTPLTTADFSTAGAISINAINPAASGGGSSNTVVLNVSASTSPNPVPTVTSLNPASVTAGAGATTLTVTGANFVPASKVNWNGAALTTTFNSATSLAATLPATSLASAGSATVTVVNPTPGGGTSNSVTFVVNAAGSAGQTTVNVVANSLAWDPVHQLIYLSLPSSDGANGNSVQTLDPVTGTLGASAFAGSEPNLLSVSSGGKYLYVSLNGASVVQRMTLPNLGTDIKINLGADSFDGPFYAMDVQAAPSNGVEGASTDGTVAVVRGTPQFSPAEEGGVVIYDDGVARSKVLCGWIQSGCYGGANLYDSIQWSADGSTMFAANNEDTGFDFYTIPVTSQGFGTTKDYGGLAGGFGENIHFDAPTGYVYDDNGSIIDPVAGAKVGTFQASGLMVPDGALGRAYFLGQTTSGYGSGTYTIQIFDIKRFTPVNTITVRNVIGTPTHLIRWGTNGLAFTTSSNVYLGGTRTGAVYLISGAIVTSGQESGSEVPANNPEGNVQRTWAPAHPVVEHRANPSEELLRVQP